jgi:prepilin signal peptidase PulO-like enzyme (type II secretory pathway)
MDFSTEFVPYIALAAVLFAIRETKKIDNKWLPLVGIVIGVLYAFWESGNFSSHTFLNGCQYGILGVGSVAAVKYFLEKSNKKRS